MFLSYNPEDSHGTGYVASRIPVLPDWLYEKGRPGSRKDPEPFLTKMYGFEK